MEKRLIQVNDMNGTIGLYSVPFSVSYKEFKETYESFEDQDDFDEHNNINVERKFVDEIYID